jgi:hypothetical protein
MHTLHTPHIGMPRPNNSASSSAWVTTLRACWFLNNIHNNPSVVTMKRCMACLVLTTLELVADEPTDDLNLLAELKKADAQDHHGHSRPHAASRAERILYLEKGRLSKRPASCHMVWDDSPTVPTRGGPCRAEPPQRLARPQGVLAEDQWQQG